MKRVIWAVILLAAQAFSQSASSVPYPSTLIDCNNSASISLTGLNLLGNEGVILAGPVPNNNLKTDESICANSIQVASGTPAIPVASDAFSIPQNIPILKTAACSGTGASGYNTICVYVPSGNQKLGQYNFKYNTVSSVLSNASVTVGAGRVTVSFSDSNTSNTASYKICYGTSSDAVKDGGGDCKDFSGISGNVIKGLSNGTDYWFAAKSANGTQWYYFGPYKPVQSFSFTEVYDGAGNPVSWNCSQSNVPPVGGLLILMLLALLSCQRPVRRSLGEGGRLASRTGFRVKPGMTVIAAMIFSASALADLGQVNLGFLGTPYRPALDLSTKPDGSQITPFYKCMYEDKLAPLMGLEVDVHLLDGFGSLQLGMATQYTFVNGSALLSKDGCERSSDSVRLHMLHLRPQLTYVLDPWVDYFPLVPYLRVGLVGVGYVFQYQDGWDQENKGGPGKNMGMVFGWSAAAGLMLSMKFLEPGTAARAVSNSVYDNIYLKAEAAYMPINNFYSQGMNFSPAWPQANKNFPIFLNFGLVFEFN